jgi:hypothetical protein
VSPAEVLEALVALCREAGIEVRRVRGGAEAPAEAAAQSSVCGVHCRPWLVLFDAEGVEERIAAAAEALRRFAPELVEGRYLPPAVRARLGPGAS